MAASTQKTRKPRTGERGWLGMQAQFDVETARQGLSLPSWLHAKPASTIPPHSSGDAQGRPMVMG